MSRVKSSLSWVNSKFTFIFFISNILYTFIYFYLYTFLYYIFEYIMYTFFYIILKKIKELFILILFFTMTLNTCKPESFRLKDCISFGLQDQYLQRRLF